MTTSDIQRKSREKKQKHIDAKRGKTKQRAKCGEQHARKQPRRDVKRDVGAAKQHAQKKERLAAERREDTRRRAGERDEQLF